MRTEEGRAHTKDPVLFSDLETSDTEDFLNGSVRTALEVEPGFDTYIFIEKDPEAFNELTEVKSDFPEKDIRFVNDEANQWLIDRCENYDWSSHRAIVFLDPFGMQVEWDTIEAIAGTQAIDLWVLFPLGVGANRLLKSEGEIPSGWKKRLNTIFGTDEWEERFYKAHPNLFGEETPKKKVGMKEIGEFYLECLDEEFAQVAENPYVLRSKNGGPLYLFCFAAANPNAADLAVKIAQYILNA